MKSHMRSAASTYREYRQADYAAKHTASPTLRAFLSKRAGKLLDEAIKLDRATGPRRRARR